MRLPVLYSYRRCPYAMRARMALRYAGIDVEIREISLRDKPRHLRQVSPKATVPVLVLADGQVIDQSLDIMQWALAQHDPEQWLGQSDAAMHALVKQNDEEFKRALDRYKYPDRYPEHPQSTYRADGERFLQVLESSLHLHGCLFGTSPTYADIAIFPFIRQFSMVDPDWFAVAPYPRLKTWLAQRIQSPLFESIMEKYPTWQEPVAESSGVT
jgi:glutathione S-transferase